MPSLLGGGNADLARSRRCGVIPESADLSTAPFANVMVWTPLLSGIEVPSVVVIKRATLREDVHHADYHNRH
jgi:hypothetical protein